MTKYVGICRVDIERDANGQPMEFTFVRGSGNHSDSKIFRYNDSKLRLYVCAGQHFQNRLDDIMVDYEVVIKASEEWVFEFEEKYFPIFATLIKARVKGCAIKPQSKRNKK